MLVHERLCIKMQKEDQKEKKKEMEMLETVMNVIATVVQHVTTF